MAFGGRELPVTPDAVGTLSDCSLLEGKLLFLLNFCMTSIQIVQLKDLHFPLKNKSVI